VRVNAPELANNANDDCKYSSNGGSDQWPMDKYLNIWVVNSIENDDPNGIILGYAYLPYWPNGANYGILIRNDSFGNIGTASGADGRTLTHEMGHLLGLQHIFDAGWGGGSGCHTDDCNQNGDYCCDTPPQAQASWGCPQILNSCTEVPVNDAFGFDTYDQIENYMSYNYCQNMFSRDQTGIMEQNFIDISFMANWFTPQNVLETGVNQPDFLCKADFEADKTTVCPNTSIQFQDFSYHGPASWLWNVTPGTEVVDWVFVDGTDAYSQNPVIMFLNSGYYTVSLNVSDGNLSDLEVKSNYIHVLPSAMNLPYWEGFETYNDLSSAQNWVIENPGNNNGFEIEPTVGSSGNQSVRLLNYFNSGNNVDELFSTPIDLESLADTGSVTMSFRYAYRKKVTSNVEWLKVFISNDCGETWVQRKTLHGSSLSSLTEAAPWYPSSPNDWTTVHMTNITPSFFDYDFRFKFRFEGSGGNNFFLDDINIYEGSPSNQVVVGLNVSEEISELQLYPNPVEDQLNLKFEVQQAQSLAIELLDISGKLVDAYKIEAVSGSNLVLFDTNKLAKGMYVLRINTGNTGRSLPFSKQ
jgi:PKD repeat protein